MESNQTSNNLTIPIFNLSKHQLFDHELSFLSKGLSFVPTTYPNYLDLQTELLRFLRKIRLHSYFLQNPCPIQTSNTPLRSPSTFLPSTNMIPSKIVTFEKMVLKEVTELENTRRYIPFNISKAKKLPFLPYVKMTLL